MQGVKFWVKSDETSSVLETDGMHVAAPQIVTHFMSGQQNAFVSTLLLYFTEQWRRMFALYVLHSFLVLSSHCSTAGFQHTNNCNCWGSSPLWSADHPGVTACQGTALLWPKLHFSPDSTRLSPLPQTINLKSTHFHIFTINLTNVLIFSGILHCAVNVADFPCGCEVKNKMNLMKKAG